MTNQISCRGHFLKAALAILLMTIMLLGMMPIKVAAAEDPYITFSSTDSFMLQTYNSAKNWNGTLEYSTDTTTWNTWDGTTTLSSSATYKLYLRGTGNGMITGGNQNARWVLTGNKSIACTGNIENLLDYMAVTAGNHPTMTDGCYYAMFYGCTSLSSAPTLPATTLAKYCYMNMFGNCTSLSSAPALPATILAYRCYEQMFIGCTSLSSAPDLPATTLANNCYYNMFMGCTSLSSAPKLPATTLANNCYYNMFIGCTSLSSAPDLPATTLANSCYSGMFEGCTALRLAPKLPATTLEYCCYQSMFSGCTSLISAPELPATTLANTCYRGMFDGCTSLSSAPELPATTLTDYCYSFMFRGCTSLSSAPALPATTLADSCYSSMFERCTSLSSAPALPATILAKCCYEQMFAGCTSLSSAPKLPATTLAYYCYVFMFRGCTSLSSAPALPATTLTEGCYYAMFEGCTSLKVSETKDNDYTVEWRIPTTGTAAAQNSWNTKMLAGTSGTFIGNPTVNTTYYLYAPIPSCTFSFDGTNAGKLMNSTTAMEYSLNGGTTWTDCTADISLPVDIITEDNDIKVRFKEGVVPSTAGPIQTIDITKATAPNLTVTQPTVLNGYGSIPMTSVYEYKLSTKENMLFNKSNWIDATGTTELPAGTYQVRVKATGTVLFSDAQIITLNAYTPAKETTTPATGDSSNMLIPIAFMAIAVFGLGIVLKKRAA